MKWLLAPLLAFAAFPAAAQQAGQAATSFRWIPGQEIVLAAHASDGLQIAFESEERVARVSMDDDAAFIVEVTGDRSGLRVMPQSATATAQLDVFTDRRFYRFRLQTTSGPEAVRYAALDETALSGPPPAMLQVTTSLWQYRIKGDREVRPAAIRDDGVRTTISFAREQALPAVFAIGPTGEEEVVNGHMRGEEYVIDRIYGELIFRIDQKRANARRNVEPEARE